MTTEQIISTEVSNVQDARWEGFVRLAKRLPDRHILAVELIRTAKDETVAVFTVVRNHEPVKYLVTGDSRGRVKSADSKPLPIDPKLQQGKPARDVMFAREAVVSAAAAAEPPVDPSLVSIGRPPPQEPTPPGVVAIGEGLLSAAFNVGEFVDIE